MSSLIQTILSASESHRVSLAARGLYHRWGITPRPEDDLVVRVVYTMLAGNASVLKISGWRGMIKGNLGIFFYNH